MKKIREKWSSIFRKENNSVQLNDKDFSEALHDVLNLLKYIEVNNSFRVFEIKDDIVQWGNMNYKIWENSLTLEEINNIKLYTSNSFKYNKHLRQDRFPSYKNRIQHIDSALRKASTPENIITYRWMELEGLRIISHSAIIHEGTKLIERGFSSTTLSFNGTPRYSGDVLFILKIPKYFNGASLHKISNIPIEDEFLLKRNSTYTVEKIIHYTDTHVILLCNVQ